MYDYSGDSDLGDDDGGCGAADDDDDDDAHELNMNMTMNLAAPCWAHVRRHTFFFASMLAAQPLHLEACSGTTPRIVVTPHSISKKEHARSKRVSNAFAAFSSNTLLTCLIVCWSHSRPKQVSVSQRTKMQLRPRKQFNSTTGRTKAGVSKLM